MNKNIQISQEKADLYVLDNGIKYISWSNYFSYAAIFRKNSLAAGQITGTEGYAAAAAGG